MNNTIPLKKIHIIILIFIITIVSFSSVISAQEPLEHTNILISLKYHLFGRIDGWHWENDSQFHWQVINGSNYRVIGIGKYTYSKSYVYGVIRKGWSWAFSGFQFKGILTQRYICGVFYNDNDAKCREFKSCKSNVVPIDRINIDFELFIGKIDRLEIQGDNYSFYALDLVRIGYWRNERSWGIEVDYAKNDEFAYSRTDYIFRGKIEPDYIWGIFRPK